MPTLADLRQAVDNLLNISAPALQLNSNTRERAFEAYAFALVAQAVRDAGGTVTLHGIQSGPNPNPVVFRGSPGHLASRAQDFCYALCELNNRTFEIHIGVEYLGMSEATHEIDVSLFDHTEANKVRAAGVLPKPKKLLAAFECKFYDSSLGTALGRTFVGLLKDCGTLKVKGFLTNGQSEPLARYLSRGQRPDPFFRISPLSLQPANRFRAHVEQALRKWANVS